MILLQLLLRYGPVGADGFPPSLCATAIRTYFTGIAFYARLRILGLKIKQLSLVGPYQSNRGFKRESPDQGKTCA
jgi:hypothetical protein